MSVDVNYKVLFEKMPQGCVIVDILSGEIVKANHAICNYLGYERDKIEGLSWMDLQQSGDLLKVADGQLLAQHYLGSDGSDRLLDTSFTLLPTTPPQILIMLSPCEERLRLEKECQALARNLEESKKLRALGQLAGGVAHDYNNLLAIISASLETVIREGMVPGVLEECLKTIERGRGLSKQILRFARREGPVEEKFSIEESMHRIAGLMGVDFKMVSSTPLFIKSDPSEFEASLVNLVSNAKEASIGEKGPWLEVGIQKLNTKKNFFHGTLAPGDYALIKISDNGPGIPAEIHERLFEPYFTTKFHKGLGLGLARVAAYVDSAHGAIDLRTSKTEGTSWHVYLPLEGNRIEEKTVISEKEGPSGDYKKMPIAIVDDEAALVRLVGRMLDHEGYNSMGFVHPKEAYEKLSKQETPFVLVTDAKMPGMSGVELVKALKAANRRFSALLMSGYSEELTGKQDIFESRLQKPIGIQSLLAALNNAQKRIM